jgi:mannose-6-phosphate isomerase-like protein (cupin superfamily)
MKTVMRTLAAAILAALPVHAAAQSASVYVGHEKVDAALTKSSSLIDLPQVKVAGAHRDSAGALATQRDTAILYITSGDALFVAGNDAQRVTRGDVIVVPAGMTQSFKSMAQPVSYYLVTVPVSNGRPAAAATFVNHEQVAVTLKKAGPLAEGPNVKVSGGYRTGPYAREDYRPDVEVHENEADLFYVVDGDATLVTGGTVVGGRTTAPGQIRGKTIDHGHTDHLAKGDVMWVPPGAPHWFPEIPHPLSYLLVKVTVGP